MIAEVPWFKENHKSIIYKTIIPDAPTNETITRRAQSFGKFGNREARFWPNPFM